jgi:hypothetical protein
MMGSNFASGSHDDSAHISLLFDVGLAVSGLDNEKLRYDLHIPLLIVDTLDCREIASKIDVYHRTQALRYLTQQCVED